MFKALKDFLNNKKLIKLIKKFYLCLENASLKNKNSTILKKSKKIILKNIKRLKFFQD